MNQRLLCLLKLSSGLLSVYIYQGNNQWTDQMKSVCSIPQASCGPLEAAIRLHFLADVNWTCVRLSYHTLKSMTLTPSCSSSCSSWTLFMSARSLSLSLSFFRSVLNLIVHWLNLVLGAFTRTLHACLFTGQLFAFHPLKKCLKRAAREKA